MTWLYHQNRWVRALLWVNAKGKVYTKHTLLIERVPGAWFRRYRYTVFQGTVMGREITTGTAPWLGLAKVLAELAASPSPFFL